MCVLTAHHVGLGDPTAGSSFVGVQAIKPTAEPKTRGIVREVRIPADLRLGIRERDPGARLGNKGTLCVGGGRGRKMDLRQPFLDVLYS